MDLKNQHSIVRTGAFLMLSFVASACTQGILGGSASKTFTGIDSAVVLSPTTIQVSWTKNSNCDSYQVVQLSNASSTVLQVASSPPVTLTKTTPIVSSRLYTFAVGCVKGTEVSGLSTQLSPTTWANFNQLVTADYDSSGTPTLVRLNWSYPQAILFDIYAQKSVIPGDLANWTLTSNGTGGYVETPICEVSGTGTDKVRLGQGGDCNPALDAGSIYNFKVVAKYPDGSLSTDLTGTGASELVPTTFTPPSCLLTQAGLGPDVAGSYLFLRCGATGSNPGTCAPANTSVRAYQAFQGTRRPISDVVNSLASAQTLRLEPQIDTTQPNDRLVSGLEIQYGCVTGGVTTTSVVRYDGTSGNMPPVLKYGNAGYEGAPALSSAQAPSSVGQSIAIGDFDCDGKPDMAVGMPLVTYGTAPYNSKNTETGVVKVYFGYGQAADGTVYSSTNNVQYLTFRDLPSFAHFGQSIAAGNVNRDIFKDASQNYYSCDDLIIGAPGNYNNTWGTYQGEAFIFYGSPQRFTSPLDRSGLATNAPSCSGTINNSVCSPVRLVADTPTFFKTDPLYVRNQPFPGTTNPIPRQSEFGFTVAFVGDHNADGYGDVAIGDPYADWDGEDINNMSITATTPNKLQNVGAVYLYFGGSGGLQNTNVGNFSDPGQPGQIITPFVKVYPPFPQTNMHFGWSISGGAEVDGGLPVPVKVNGGNDIILATGSDFVVGAPEFNYAQDATVNYGTDGGVVDTSRAWSLTASTDGVDPTLISNVASGTSSTPKSVAPLNGAWTSTANWNGKSTAPKPTNAKLLASTGIAFLYRGRHSFINYSPTIKTGVSPALSKLPINVSGASEYQRLLAQNKQDRETGSNFLTHPAAISTLEAPLEAFYNCSNRGVARSQGGSGYHHYSCLAGRDNFSVIYPELNATSDNPVNRFGASVALAGGKDVNAMALYQLGSSLNPGHYWRADDGKTLLTNASAIADNGGGGTHDAIRGTALWELGISGLTVGTANTQVPSESFTTNGAQNGATAATYKLGRSALRESFLFPNVDFTSTPDAIPVTDVNRDGYADVIVGTSPNSGVSSLYTYFGNYAADFSYSDSLSTPYGAPGSCSVTRTAPANINDNTVTFTSALPTTGTSNTFAFSTYYTRIAAGQDAGSAPAYFVKGEYPVYPQGTVMNLRYLDDITEGGSTLNLSYPTVTRSTQSADAATRCLPQRKTYTTPSAISALAATDLNGDGIVDVAIGMPDDNNSQGKAVVAFGSSTGSGLIADTNFTNGVLYGSTGTSVAAVNWKFITNHIRRDLWVGAPGTAAPLVSGGPSVPGAGMLYTYTASDLGTLNSGNPYTLTDSQNTPNYLQANRSKIIGDVNGDGYDDILVPVKHYGNGGTVYYDGVVYYGSLYGPITTQYCQNHLSSITLAGGGAASSASICTPTLAGGAASIAGTQIHLPQILPMPVGVDSLWILGAFGAGDIDHDGKDDIIVIESTADTNYTLNNRQRVYAFFGSDSGLVGGSPQFGPSNNHSPQLVVDQSPFTYINGSTNYFNSSTTQNGTATRYPFAHGDFNGDGYEDIAIGLPQIESPALNTTWTCSAVTQTAGAYSNQCGGITGVATNYGVKGHGAIFIVYGGPNGLQTPTNGSGVPSNYDSFNQTCDDFYGTCTTPGIASVMPVYGSLAIDGALAVTINSTKTACVPQTGNPTMPSLCTRASLVRNPMFHNELDSFTQFTQMFFGASFTVADVNGDGVDDLVVGNSNYSNTGYGAAGSAKYGTTLTQGADDAVHKGGILIYYGAKNFGLVAPVAKSYVGNAGLGLNKTTSAANVDPNATAFALYAQPSDATHAYHPKLDTTETSRGYGELVSAGDFNGDGIDDIATVSGSGQVYITYGPICQYDNSASAALVAYQNENKAVVLSSLTPTSCNVMSLNLLSGTPGGTYTAGSLTPSTHKTLNFQTTYITNSVTASQGFGTTLVARRPVRTIAGTFVKNPGNIDGDADKTSDLVVGSALVSDPNANITNGKVSGVGYLFFGHPNAGGTIVTQPGLYIGTPNYNSSVTSSVISGVTNYFYSPMLLKPHTSDGANEGFFTYQTSLGDLNGDGRGDLLFNTRDVQQDTSGNQTVYGGGFKLFY